MFKSANLMSHIVPFLVATFLLFYPGAPEGAITQIIAGVLGAYSGGNILFKYFSEKPQRVAASAVLKAKSFWVNLATTVTAFLPVIPIETLNGMIEAAFSGNFQLILIQLFNLVGIIFKLLKK